MDDRASNLYGDNRHFRINEQEELNLVLEAKRGDSGALAELLEWESPLIEKVALEFGHSPLTNKELFELGKKALLNLIRIFDPSRGTKFGSFAYWGIRQALEKASNNRKTLKVGDESSKFSMFGDALDAAIALKAGDKSSNPAIFGYTANATINERTLEENPQVKQPIKAEVERQFFVNKRIDWCTLNHGLTIPVNKIGAFMEHLSFVPQVGKMYPVTVTLDGKDYQVQVIDVNFSGAKRSRVVQIRYTSASPLAIKLQAKFRSAYQQLANDRQNFTGINTYISLVNDARLDCFSLEFSGDNTLVEEQDSQDKVDVAQTLTFSLADEIPRVAHSKPYGFTFYGQYYPVNSWTGFVVEIGKLVCSCKHGDLLEEVEPDAIEFTDRYPCIGKDAGGMIAPKCIGDNLWIETNFNAKQLVDFAKWMTWWCDIDQSKVVVKYQPKETRKQEVLVPNTNLVRISVPIVPDTVIDALNHSYASGFRFDATYINLLSNAAAEEIDGEMQLALKRIMFCRADGIYFLFDLVASAATRKEIIDFADSCLEEYGCFEISEFYKLYEEQVNSNCIRNADDFESFYAQIGRSNVRCVQAPYVGNRIVRYSNGAVGSAFEKIAKKIISVITEEYYGSCSEDDLQIKFCVFSTDLLGKIIKQYASDELIRVEINDSVCYQTFDALGLPANFSEILTEVLQRLSDIDLDPTQDALHITLSLKLGVNFKMEYNLPDWETYRRLITAFYKTEPRREWKSNIFGEVN